MSIVLDQSLKNIIGRIGLQGPEYNKWNDEIVNRALEQVKRIYVRNALYEDIEPIIERMGEEELKEIQGLVEQRLEEVRKENP